MATYKPKQFIQQIDSIANSFMSAIKEELMDMGLAAEKHFDGSFENEGFTNTDGRVEGWEELSSRRIMEKDPSKKILEDTGKLRASKSLSYGGGTGILKATISYSGLGARNNHGFMNEEGFQVPKRKFIGTSYSLNMNMLNMLEARIKRVFGTNYTVGRG